MKRLYLKLIEISDLPKIGVQVFNKISFGDDRGALTVEYEGDVQATDWSISVKESQSQKGVGRGLHYQSLPFPQKKLINVVEGEIYDFLLDITGAENCVYCFKLTANDNVNLLIPENFAHGFITLTDVRFRYTCFGKYNEECESTINVLQSAAMALGLGEIVLSKKDSLVEKILLLQE